MKNNFVPVIVFAGIIGSAYLSAASECAVADGDLNITIPCVEDRGRYYRVQLSRYDNYGDIFGYYWTLGKTTRSANLGSCSTVDGSMNLVIPCVEKGGSRYQIRLNQYGNSADFFGYLWSLGGVSIIGTTSTSTSSPVGSTFTNSLGMTFNPIPAGTFMMGSSPIGQVNLYFNETQHRVTLTSSFYMQTTEVTQGQWQAVMGSNPANHSSCGADCPVENVSWDDVQGFIVKLNQQTGQAYRLPTEAEWEYAARAGSVTEFANGEITTKYCEYDQNLDVMGWYCGNSEVSYSGCYDISNRGGPSCAGPHPVGQKQANGWGLYDMHGNVYEWCADRYQNYLGASDVSDPQGSLTGTSRVLRGGSWDNNSWDARSGNRNGFMPDNRTSILGFRLVLSAG